MKPRGNDKTVLEHSYPTGMAVDSDARIDKTLDHSPGASSLQLHNTVECFEVGQNSSVLKICLRGYSIFTNAAIKKSRSLGTSCGQQRTCDAC